MAAVGLLIAGLTGCSSVARNDASHADAVKAWRNQAQPSIDRMNDAMAWFEGAVKTSDYGGALNACHSFAGGVDSLEQHLPAPDDGVTAALREAVSHFRDFDRECPTVNADITQDRANLVVSYRDQGVERIKAAVDMMNRLEQQ
jgi:hypothetical protein